MADKKDKTYFWLKLPRDFFKKHYIEILLSKDDGKMLVLFYIWMLTESIDHEGTLRYSESKPYNAEMLSEVSHFSLQFVTSALQIFSDLELVITESDGTLFLPKSLKMIGSETASAQRAREYRDRKKTETKTAENSENAALSESEQQCNNIVQKCNTEKELELEKELDIKKKGGKPKRETTLAIFERLSPNYPFSDEVSQKIREWIKYKTEKKDSYKEQGMKSLLNQILTHTEKYGDTAVCSLIDECMANGWKGIIWDKLKNSQRHYSTADRIGNRVNDVDNW